MSYDPIWSILIVESDYKYVVVGRESGSIEKYKLTDLKGKPILTLKTAHRDTVTTLALAPQGGDEIYSGSLDKSICHWNLTDDTEFLETEAGGKRLVKTTLTTTGIRCGVVVSEMLCCGGSDGGVHALREGAPERWMGHTDAVSCVAQCQTENGDGILASGSYDGQIRIWNTATGVCLYLLRGHVSHVKCVQFINGCLGVMACGRDDTARLWLLPEELDLEGRGAAGDGDEEEGSGGGEDGSDEDGEISHRLGKHRGAKGGDGIKRFDCVAILGLPASPMCISAQAESDNPLVAVGFSGGALATFKANKFYSSVASFTKINTTEVKRERKRLEALLKAEEKKELTQRKKAIRKKKKELVEEQRKDASDAKNKEKGERAAQRAAERAAARDEYADEEEDEEMPEENDEDIEDDEDEEGEEFELTEDRQTALDEFKEKQKTDSDERLRSLRTAVGDRKRLLEPIGAKKYERDAKQFADLSFTRFVPRAAPETINAIGLSGTHAVAAVGGSLKLIDSTPGVQSL